MRLLGETAGELELDDSVALRDVAVDMAGQAKRCIHIISRDLDAALYDNGPFVDAISTLVRRSKYSFVKVLIHDSTAAVKSGHRLLALHQRLSSEFHIRKIHKEFSDYNNAIMLVDEVGYIYRTFADRYEATADYAAPLHTKKLLEKFSEIWECSHEDPNLRRLHI